jgi:hypothetical protein
VGRVVVADLCACGHETMFPRSGHRLFEPDQVEREVRTYYATCNLCAKGSPVNYR